MNPNTGQPIQNLTVPTNNPQSPNNQNKNSTIWSVTTPSLGDIFGPDEIVTTKSTLQITTPIPETALETNTQVAVTQSPLTTEVTNQIPQTLPIANTTAVQTSQIATPVIAPTETTSTQTPTISSPATVITLPTQQQRETVTTVTPPSPQIPVQTQITTSINTSAPAPIPHHEYPMTQSAPVSMSSPAPTTPPVASTPQPTTSTWPVVTQNTQTLTQAGTVAQIPQNSAPISAPVGVIPPKIVVKKWSKISPLKFIIGCGVFGFLLIGAVGFILYFALQNPTQFQGIIGIEGIKTGLKLFAGLFFGMLFLWSFVTIIFNLYKLITQKTGSKIKYVIWLIFSALVLGWTVFGGIVSFNRINEIIETTGANNSILLPYIQFKDKARLISEWFPIIAPTKVLYGTNETLLTRFLTTNFVNKQINSLKLDCGNGTQILNYNQSQKQFNGQCLYLKKWDYPIKFITNITDKATGVTEDITSDLWPLSITTEVSLVPSSWTLSSNDANDEIIIGKAPTKINFDSTSIFTDLKLSEYKIQRDLDGDGQWDKSDLTNFSYQFRKPQVQSIYYTLPNIGQYSNLVYQIDLRVLQNDVPICTITTTPSTASNTTYTISTTFDTDQVIINSYMYRIKNLSNNRFWNALTNKKESFDYDFWAQGNYVVYLNYVTEDGKQWSCESDTIEVGASTFDVKSTLQYKWPNDTSRTPLTTTGIVSLNDKKISSTVLPIKLLLTINSISPQSSTTKTVVKLDNQIIQTPNGKSYEITLTNSTHELITIQISDPITKAITLLEYPIHITQEDIIGKLNTFPSSVWTSPFEVTLDASTTTLTDKDDEIIYFTWDYGDGEIITNSSQSRTTHTYVYDENTQNGTYNPTVTVTTKKWKVAKFGIPQPILVKKPTITARIDIDSHPAQIASVGDKVDFSLHTDGTPTKIIWDFWTSEDIECFDRSCASVPMFFTTPGTYTVNATITYKYLNSTTATTKIVIE